MEHSGLVSIIIVNWNTRDLLLQCLRSIRDTTADLAYEVVVVDNASSDGSVAAVEAEFPQARLIANRENRGFGAANNQGAALARGEYLLFLNPDTVVLKGSVASMREFLSVEEQAGVVGCKILNPDGSLQTSWWMDFPSVGWCWKSAAYLNNRPQGFHAPAPESANQPAVVSHLLGACLMMRREVFDELGGFDEKYFLYLEETDLCYRAVLLGKRNYYLPDGSIIHLGQQSSIKSADWANVQLQFSTYAFIRSRGELTGGRRIILMLGMALGCLIRIVLWSCRLALGKPKRRTALLMLKGYWRLLLTIGKFEALLQRRGGDPIRIP